MLYSRLYLDIDQYQNSFHFIIKADLWGCFVEIPQRIGFLLHWKSFVSNYHIKTTTSILKHAKYVIGYKITKLSFFPLVLKYYSVTWQEVLFILLILFV